MPLQIHHTYVIVLQSRFLYTNCTKFCIRAFPYSILSNNDFKEPSMQIVTTSSTVKKCPVNELTDQRTA